MPRSKSKSKPASFSLQLNPAWVKAGIWAISLVVIVLLVCYFEGVNRTVQLDRRLSSDPRLSEWYASVKKIAQSSEDGTPRAGQPVAVWHGKIADVRDLVVDLHHARLMAGSKGKRDRPEKLTISILNSNVPQQGPQKGDEWVFAVKRNADDHSQTHSAYLYKRAGS